MAALSTSSVEEEAEENVRRIRPMIPLWRQKSREYSDEFEEDRKRQIEERNEKRYSYVALGLLAGITFAMVVWKRYIYR